MRYRLIAPKPQAQPATQVHRLIFVTELEYFLRACKVDRLAPATLKYYEYTLTRFISFLAAQGIHEADKTTASDVRSFLLDLQATAKPQSLHDYYRAIRRFFNWMVLEGDLARSPMATIKPPKVPKYVIRPFTKEEILLLLANCQHGRLVDFRNTALILLFVDTGLRAREMANVQISELDFDHDIIKVMGKGAKERVVRMSLGAQKALLSYLKLRQRQYPDSSYAGVWVNQNGRQLTQDGIRVAIREIAKRAGITGVRCSPHTFRHTFATMAIRNGANLFHVQRILGHATLSMTRKYAESIDSEEAVKAHEKFSPVDNWKLR